MTVEVRDRLCLYINITRICYWLTLNNEKKFFQQIIATAYCEFPYELISVNSFPETHLHQYETISILNKEIYKITLLTDIQWRCWLKQ